MSDVRQEFIYYGFQYYMLGRCGVAAWAHPVAANLFHHAVEMLLKAELARHTTEEDRRKLGHRLPDIWEAFKAIHPSNQLARFDALIGNLHKYEDIRYPEKTAQQGMQNSFQFGSGPPPKASGKLPTFNLSVGEVDALVKAICDVCSINPKFFTTRFQPPGSAWARPPGPEGGQYRRRGRGRESMKSGIVLPEQSSAAAQQIGAGAAYGILFGDVSTKGIIQWIESYCAARRHQFRSLTGLEPVGHVGLLGLSLSLSWNGARLCGNNLGAPALADRRRDSWPWDQHARS
jgi:hypothetical protein